MYSLPPARNSSTVCSVCLVIVTSGSSSEAVSSAGGGGRGSRLSGTGFAANAVREKPLSSNNDRRRIGVVAMNWNGCILADARRVCASWCQSFGTRPPLPGSAGTPAARTFHAGDLAGLLHVTVGKQLEHCVARFGSQAFLEMFHDMADIGRDLMIRIILAHEMDRIPVVFCKLDVFLKRKLHSHFLVPVLGLDQIAFFVCVR